jgi:CheY-like chemotaxis protein
VKIDPSQLDQVIANLCVNARDAIQGQGKLRLETFNSALGEADCEGQPGAQPGDFVTLAVRDNGKGMDAETLAHLFEPFFTTKANGLGTGLGLATVYGIVRQNRGVIRVESTPGQGSNFLVSLPRHLGAGEAAPAEAPASPATAKAATILVVEDEPAILDLTRLRLKEAGHQVLSAQGPELALRLASEHPGSIDLLLTDVVMPGMNGKEICDALRRSRPGIPCVYMSGYTADVITRQGDILTQGVRLLQKPFTKGELLQAVRAALDSPGTP